MKYVRVQTNNGAKYGILKNSLIQFMENTPFDGNPVLLDEAINAEDAVYLAPVPFSKAVCIGLNYRDHAVEFGLPIPESPVIFLKPSTSATGHRSSIIYPAMCHRLDYEAELAVVIGKKAKNVSEEDALSYVLGYTIANDVTARDLQPKTGQWTIAKSFDTFLPLGPFIETDLDPDHLEIIARVNGKVVQRSNTENLIFKPKFLVSWLSHRMTLNPGDVILTGTPSGTTHMNPGDTVEVEIEGLGILKSTVVAE